MILTKPFKNICQDKGLAKNGELFHDYFHLNNSGMKLFED